MTRELVLRPGAFGLGSVPLRMKPERTTTMVCGYCSTGCGLNIHLRRGEAVNLTAAPEYPVNLGMACPKGWEALTPLKAADRATTPKLRDAAGRLRQVSWDTAMRVFCDRFKSIQRAHGPESVAWLGTGQICTEELAFLGALGKFGMGLRHGDGNTRQCMATSVAAYKQSFGFDAPPYTYADFEESDAIVLVGSNLCIAHPILWQRILRNRRRPDIIVVDPRKTETAMNATQHLALAPKSDLALFYGLAHLLIARGWVDHAFVEAHTSGMDAFAAHVREFTPDRTAAATGLPVVELERFAETLHRRKRASLWWTMGVNQGHEATRTAQAIINVALLTGNIGRPGTGANSITGQCNAMGSRLFSNTTNLLGGHDFLNPAHRRKAAALLDLPLEAIPATNSWAYDQILQGIANDHIKGLWIIATNPAHSWINQTVATGLLRKLEFLVVQDMYDTTETAQHAGLILPAAGWGEKDGTFINSERRIGLAKKVCRAPGQALADFHIFQLVARAWGCAGLFREWSSPEAVFHIMKRLSAGQPCDITGIDDYRMIDECGGVQWPFTAAQRAAAARRPGPDPGFTERRLFEDGTFFTPDGRARFCFDTPQPVPEPVDAAYPFLLLTGRGTSAQWHTQTRTGKSAVLRALYPRHLHVEINPADAKRLGVESHTWVEIASRRGRLEALAFVTPIVQPGQLFLPMHDASTNHLTFPAFDPHSRQPSYKACAVRVQPLNSSPTAPTS